MFNQYNNPAYQTITSGLKEGWSTADLEDNPKDDGIPNIGALTARPLFQTLDVTLGLQNISIDERKS